jgi:hypothetical protein
VARGQPKTRPAPPLKERLLALFFFATTITASYIAWDEHTQIAGLNTQIAESVATRVASAAPRPTLTPPEPGADNPPPPDEPPPPNGPAAFAALMNNPQMQQFVDARIGQMVDTNYADLFQQLNLSQTDSDNLRGLLVQRASVWRDVLNTATAQGLDPATDRDQFRQMMTEAQGQVDTSIHTLLGDMNFETYQTYNATVQQNFRANFGGGFGGGGFGGAGGPPPPAGN